MCCCQFADFWYDCVTLQTDFTFRFRFHHFKLWNFCVFFNFSVFFSNFHMQTNFLSRSSLSGNRLMKTAVSIFWVWIYWQLLFERIDMKLVAYERTSCHWTDANRKVRSTDGAVGRLNEHWNNKFHLNTKKNCFQVFWIRSEDNKVK